jgi:hypothetical protein
MKDLFSKFRIPTPTSVAAPKALQNPWIYIVSGVVVMGLACLFLIVGSSKNRAGEKALVQAAAGVEQVTQATLAFRRVLEDEQVQAMAALALENPGNEVQLRQYLAGRLGDSVDVLLFDKRFEMVDPAELGPGGFIILDMLFAQEAGLVPLQVFDRENGAVLAGLTEIKVSGEKTGYLFITISPESFAPGFGIEGLDLEYMALDQVNDRMAPRLVKEAGDISQRSLSAARVRVPGTLFRVVVPQDGDTSIFSRQQKWLLLVLGVLLLAFGLLLRREMMNPKQELAGDPEQIGPPDDDLSSAADEATAEQMHPENPDDKSQPDPGSDTRIETESRNQPDPSPAPEEDLRDLVFDKPLRRRRKSIERPPVELTKSWSGR